MNNRDMISRPLQHHELSLLDSLSSHRPVVVDSPVDINNVIKEDIANAIIEAMVERDLKLLPLKEHKKRLVHCLALDGGSLRESATKIFEPRLKEKWDGLALQLHKLRLFGQLAYKGFKSTDDNKLTLPSFSRYPLFQIVRVPGS